MLVPKLLNVELINSYKQKIALLVTLRYIKNIVTMLTSSIPASNDS